MKSRVGVWVSCALVFLVALSAVPAHAQRGMSLIRDAEIEHIIRTYATPLWQVAGLDPDSIDIHIVNDDSLNAFVAAGQNLFMNTGLLLRSENPSQVIGVIAHESGHISGGHLSRTQDEIGNAMTSSILGMLLGGAAMATGRGDLGAAIMQGSQQLAMNNFMSFSRGQESAADTAAMRFLDATGQSAKGFAEFFDILGEQELLSANQQQPYARTHPLSRDRVDAVRTFIAKSRFSDTPTKPEFELMHSRMKAKLTGFMRPLQATLKSYPETDTSMPARYARSIAYYRVANLAKSTALIDQLIAEYPNDAYFHELKGQMLFENGRGAESLPSYERAVSLDPASPLLRVELAHAQIERNDPALRVKAIEHLQFALSKEPNETMSWRYLATAYGQNDQMGESSLALAEEAMLKRNTVDAVGLAKRAQGLLPRGSANWLRAGDIIALNAKIQKKK
jgi:predicted Zn-dependent protease